MKKAKREVHRLISGRSFGGAARSTAPGFKTARGGSAAHKVEIFPKVCHKKVPTLKKCHKNTPLPKGGYFVGEATFVLFDKIGFFFGTFSLDEKSVCDVNIILLLGRSFPLPVRVIYKGESEVNNLQQQAFFQSFAHFFKTTQVSGEEEERSEGLSSSDSFNI